MPLGQPKNPYRAGRDKLFRRASALMKSESLNSSEALARASAEFAILDKSNDRALPKEEVVTPPMDLDALMALRTKLRPKE